MTTDQLPNKMSCKKEGNVFKGREGKLKITIKEQDNSICLDKQTHLLPSLRKQDKILDVGLMMLCPYAIDSLKLG